jgi:hypothetical protein
METLDILDGPEEIPAKSSMKIEIIFAVLFVVALLFKIQHWPMVAILLTLSLAVPAALYFPLGFYYFPGGEINRQNPALSVVAGLFLSIALLAVLFNFLLWPGADVMIKFAAVTTPITLAATYYLKQKAPRELQTYFNNMIIRASVIAVLVIGIYMW